MKIFLTFIELVTMLHELSMRPNERLSELLKLLLPINLTNICFKKLECILGVHNDQIKSTIYVSFDFIVLILFKFI